jgi:hypothetical protein
MRKAQVGHRAGGTRAEARGCRKDYAEDEKGGGRNATEGLPGVQND